MTKFERLIFFRVLDILENEKLFYHDLIGEFDEDERGAVSVYLKVMMDETFIKQEAGLMELDTKGKQAVEMGSNGTEVLLTLTRSPKLDADLIEACSKMGIDEKETRFNINLVLSCEFAERNNNGLIVLKEGH